MISRLVSSVRTSLRETVMICVHAHSVETLISSVAAVWRQPLRLPSVSSATFPLQR
jgi:hypothetical protein